MKRKSPTPWLPFSSRLLLRPLTDISLATWDLDPFHCIKDIICCGWRFIHTWAIAAKINETDVNLTCNLQKVWDSSDSLNGNGCSLLIYIRSTIPVLRRYFWTRWNAITVRKGREKGQFWGISYFWIEVFFKECKLSPVRSIGDNDFLRVISWACWYYHPLLVLVNYLLCYVAIYIC